MMTAVSLFRFSFKALFLYCLVWCCRGEGIVTERLYPILVMSGLPRELLGRLWSLANTQTPGQLTRTELWTLLAFIALVQVNSM